MSNYSLNDLLQIMERLRSDNGCPWDREQTLESLKKYVLEEAYEVVDAIDSGNKDKHSEELGDLLLQIVFQSQLAKEEGKFTMDDVISSICSKMIYRHPHVFGDISLKTANDVNKKWDELKNREKNFSTYTQNLRDVPKNMSALMRSCKIISRASKSGFDWEKPEDAFKKIEEETLEIKEVIGSNNKQRLQEEIGDLIFAVVNFSRMLDIDPEIALISTMNKFIERFNYIEQSSLKLGKKLNEMSLEEMDKLWQQAKNEKDIL